MAAGRELTHAMVLFSDLLRSYDVPITTSAVIDAVRALEAVDVTSREEVHLALRTVMVARIEHQPVFDRCFNAFWQPDAEGLGDATMLTRPTPPRRRHEGGTPEGDGVRHYAFPETDRESDAAVEDDRRDVPRGSSRELLMEKDFSSFPAEQLDDVLALTMQIAKHLALRLGRRRMPAAKEGTVDLRRSLRTNLSKGEVIELLRRRRRRRKISLIVLCDVSGSMDLYSRFLLQFVYALQNAFRRVETFTFATRLTRISELLRQGSYKQTLRHLSEVQDWSGGTRIGEALRSFNQNWAKLADRRTIVVILSDGWDTGDPEMLAAEMLVLKRRMGRIVWLNPLLGTPSYAPLNRGMAAALQYIDHFAPAHNLTTLRDLAGQVGIW